MRSGVEQQFSPEGRLGAAYEAGCAGKEAYTSQSAAHSALRTYRSMRMHDAGRMEPYRCDFCGSWHLGHPKRGAH